MLKKEKIIYILIISSIESSLTRLLLDAIEAKSLRIKI